MPRGPRGEKRPADVIGNAVKVMRITEIGRRNFVADSLLEETGFELVVPLEPRDLAMG